MSWLRLLFHANYVISAIAGVTVLYQLFPAYRSTKNRAILYILWAYLLGLFDLLCRHTIGNVRMPHSELVLYRTLDYLTYFAAVILGAIGIIKLTRDYMITARKREDDTRDGLTSR